MRAEATQIGALRPTIVVGATNATAAIFGAVRAAAAQVGALRPTIVVGASNATAAAFNAARSAATALGLLRPTITVAGNNATGPAFNAARTAAAQVGALRPTIHIDADASRWIQVATLSGNAAMALARLRPTITVAGNNATGAAFNAARGAATQLGSMRPTITVAGNNATGPAFNAARASAAQLSAIRPTITVNGSAAQWAAVASAAGNVALALSRLRPTITVTGNNNTGPAFAAATAGAVAVGRLRPTVTVTGNVAPLTGQLAIASAETVAFSTLTQGIVRGIGTALGGMSLQWVLIGAAIAALLPAITPVIGGVLTLGGAAVGLAGGLGLVAAAAYTLANSSVPATVTAFTNLTNSWTALQNMMLANPGFNAAAQILASIGQIAINIAANQLPLVGTVAQATMANVRTAFTGAIDVVGTSTANSFSTILSYIPSIMGNITSAVTGFGAGFMAIMSEAVPQALQFSLWIVDTANAFFQWADSEEGREQVRLVISQIVPVAQALWQALTDIVPKLIDIGITYGPTVAQAITDISGIISTAITIITTVIGVITTFVGWLNAILSAAQSAGTAIHNFFTGMIEQAGGIPASLDRALSTVVSVISAPFIAAWNWLSGYLRSWASAVYNFGANVINSIVNAMVETWNSIRDKVTSIGTAILDTLKGALTIFSPAHLPTEFGENVGRSLGDGMLSQIRYIQSAANAMGSAAMPQIAPLGGTIPIWRAGTTSASVLGSSASPGPMSTVSPTIYAGGSRYFDETTGRYRVGTQNDRLANLEALMAQQNALLASGIKLDGDTTGRIGAETAGGFSNRLRNDMWTRQDVIEGQTKSLESAKFGGLLK